MFKCAVCFAMILMGGLLVAFNALQHHKLMRKISSTTRNKKPFARLTNIIAETFLWFFVFVYAFSAINVLRSDKLYLLDYLFGLIFFLSGIFVSLMARNERLHLEVLLEEDEEKRRALEGIEAQNLLLSGQMTTQLEEVKRRGYLLHTINDIAAILQTADAENFDSAMRDSFEMLAESMNVDYVHIWKNRKKNRKLFCAPKYKWSKTDGFQTRNTTSLELSYDIMQGWENAFLANKSINTLVRNLSKREREELKPYGLISILVTPIFLQEQFWGIIILGDCINERIFSKTEEDVLHSAAILFAINLQRHNMTIQLSKVTKKALAGSKAKTEFLANISHEIRTPINAITGMSTIARTTNDIDKIHSCLDKVNAASRQLLVIINDILDMSKIEAHKIKLESKPFDLRLAVQNVKDIIEMRAIEKKQTLMLRIAKDVPQMAIGDDMRLSQILFNLLSNAVKFTPEGGHISLSLKLLHTKNGKHLLEAQVKDDGIGITKEQRSMLFGSFKQIDMGASKRYSGIGLGLVITKNIVELMNGKITIESELNKGSCFTASFYLKACNKDTIQADNKPLYDFSGCTALLAEDVLINQEIVKTLLEDHGVKVECASNGQEAVDAFLADSRRYDIIFMDLQMPVMDGYTAASKIRCSGNINAEAVPILAMTANTFSEDIANCLAVGMNDHIGKPIDINMLLHKMDQLLPKKADAKP